MAPSNRTIKKESLKKARMQYIKQFTVTPVFYKVKRVLLSKSQRNWANRCRKQARYYTAQVVVENDNTINPKGWADPRNLHTKQRNGLSPYDEILRAEELVSTYGILHAAAIAKEEGTKLRFSYTGKIQFNRLGYPLNPIGRTGLKGRGFLGNWGPNHAADPVVCRINPETGRLQFVLVLRADNNEWALPGGMVEAGQTIPDARTREFAEESLGYEPLEGETDEEFNQRVKTALSNLFSYDEDNVLFEGVVDDPRNTDNAWMETTVMLTFLTGSNANLELKAGDDAKLARWINYEPDMKLFASHSEFIDLAVERLLKDGNIRH
jgi:ADP-ribose pyrophosphatase YjhB (NUDIX family)